MATYLFSTTMVCAATESGEAVGEGDGVDITFVDGVGTGEVLGFAMGTSGGSVASAWGLDGARVGNGAAVGAAVGVPPEKSSQAVKARMRMAAMTRITIFLFKRISVRAIRPYTPFKAAGMASEVLQKDGYPR